MRSNTSQGDNSLIRLRLIRSHIPDFLGMTLVDIGCEEGFFCEAFLKYGGKSAHGIEINDGSIAICNSLNLDNFIVSKELPDKEFDICFYLSLHFHNGIDYLKWCKEHSKILFVETSGNPEASNALNFKLFNDLKNYYKNIKELGMTSYANRMMYLCY